MSVMRYRGDDEAVAIANDSQYGLTGAVWGTDVDRAVGSRASASAPVRSRSTAAVLGEAPFGGFKQSGIGREGGLLGLRSYMEPKAIGIPL